MLSLFLASVEGTVVATAMPTIVAQLGGLAIYSWVFSVYMLASTTSGPIYGKLSDVYGRKQVYVIAMLIFLGGSLLCGQARSMEQLILFRAVQGLGAGGVLPLAFTVIGELFSVAERARMQGWISGVWGVSSVIGPLIGGFLVDQVSWQWVFYINLIPGVLACALVWLAWNKPAPSREERLTVDYPGAALLTLGVLALLLGLQELSGPLGYILVAGSIGLFALLLRVERRSPNPILPLHLFRDRLFVVTLLHGLLAGWAMFGSLNYVPLFVQGVLGTGATEAGIALTPMSLAWTVASVVGAQLLMRVGYRSMTLVGMVMLSAGAFLMTRINPQTSVLTIMIFTGLMGMGMGFSVPAFLIAVQSKVPRADLGSATSTVQFSRSIGGTIGVSVLGVALTARLASALLRAGIDPATVSLSRLIDPVAAGNAVLDGPIRGALGESIAFLFVISFAAALLGLIVVLFAPSGSIGELEQQREAGQNV
jgi:EmrB/QacA subfamily drug resistance transporter